MYNLGMVVLSFIIIFLPFKTYTEELAPIFKKRDGKDAYDETSEEVALTGSNGHKIK